MSIVHPTHGTVVLSTDTIFIVQRRDGEFMISLYAGENRPEEATDAAAKQVRRGCIPTRLCSRLYNLLNVTVAIAQKLGLSAIARHAYIEQLYQAVSVWVAGHAESSSCNLAALMLSKLSISRTDS